MKAARHRKQHEDCVIQARNSEMPMSKAVDSHDEICFIPTVALQSGPFFQQKCAAPPVDGTYEYRLVGLETWTTLTLLGLELPTMNRLVQLTERLD